MTMMRAAVLREHRQPLLLTEIETPKPADDSVVVRVVASGVCHSDVHIIDGESGAPKLPVVPGHEIAGVVSAVGATVTTLKVGDRVGVPWLHRTCGVCEYCVTGRETLCAKHLTTGYAVNGGYAEYVSAPAAFCAPLPESLGFADAAPILCAGLTTYKGLKETTARPGEWVVIVGIGGLGHLAVQYARAMGLRVAAVDVAEDKLALAKQLGAEIALNAVSDDPPRTLRRSIGGAHAALITAVAPAAFKQGVAMLRRGGTCVMIGLPPGDFPLAIMDVVLKGLTIRGSYVGTRQDLAEALRFAGDGLVRSVVETQPFDTVNEQLDRLRRGAVTGRVVLSVTNGS